VLLGLVEGSGTVIEHTHGYRVGHAKVIRAWEITQGAEPVEADLPDTFTPSGMFGRGFDDIIRLAEIEAKERYRQ
jgi:hypothetical protein